MRFARRHPALAVLGIFAATVLFSLSACAIGFSRNEPCRGLKIQYENFVMQDNCTQSVIPPPASPGDFPAVNMSDFMFMRQDRMGAKNVHLKGYALTFDPARPNTILSVSSWGFMKTAQIADAPDGTPRFVIMKGVDGGFDFDKPVTGVPLELYNVKDGKVFLVYEQMNWGSDEYREHRHKDGTLSFPWASDNSKPYTILNYADADHTWHFCADPSKDYYQPFGPYMNFPSRVFDLTTESFEAVAKELNEPMALDDKWLDFPKILGYPDAHVLFVVDDYYWGPLASFASEADKTNYQYREAHWETHERYKYMALKLPDGSLLPIGCVGATWFTHTDPTKPMIQPDSLILNEIVFEGVPVKPRLSCEPH